MKKFVFTIGLCLVTVLSFGQKKVVTEALKLAKDSKPNFVEARVKIKAALQHPETKDDAKTWYTAGQIESIQFDRENVKNYQGIQPNEAVMYSALSEVYPFFLRAYELDMKPDAKGKVKPKHVKDMKSIMKINLPFYINGGGYYYEQEDYKKSVDFFDQYITIYDSPLLKEGEKAGVVEPLDSNYIYATYYAAVFSSMLDSETAIRAMTRATKFDYNQYEVYQFLAETYEKVEDMANYEKTLTEGLALFPTEPYFILNLVKIFVETERTDKAVEHIQMAIKLDPDNAQLLNAAGQIYELGFNDLVKAEEYFLKAIEKDGDNPEPQYNVSRIYHNQGVAQLNTANEISDVKLYDVEREKAKVLFRKALPYLEKAYQLNEESTEIKNALRTIYYNLEMGDKLEKLGDM